MSLENYIKNNQSKFDDQKISTKADVLFEQRLRKELHMQKSNSGQWKVWLVAASTILVVSTLFWFQALNSKEAQFKKEFMANLNNESTGVRLEAVYAFNDQDLREDQEMIKVLVKTLLKDENSNVKIATIDALLQFPQNEFIRKSLVKAIEKEKEPLVQIKLIKSLKILREKRAQKPLEKIIKDNTTYPIVKENATLAMVELKQ